MTAETPVSEKKASLSFKDLTREQKLVFLSLSLGFIAMISTNTLQAPFFSPEATKHGVSISLVGVIYSVGSLVSVFVSPFIGPLIAVVGPKYVIIGGIAFNGIAMIILGLLEDVESYTGFVIGCFFCMSLYAFGGAGVYTATITYAAKMFPDIMNFVVGTTETYIAIGEIISLATGGFLYDIGGFKFPFIFFSVILLLAIPLDMIFLPSDRKDMSKEEVLKDVQKNPELEMLEKVKVDSNGKDADQTDPLKPAVDTEYQKTKNGKTVRTTLKFWHLATIPRALIMAFAILVTGVCWSFLASTLEPHLSPLELTKTETNMMYLLMSIVYGVSCPLWGWVADRMKKTWLLTTIGSILAGIAYCFLGPLPFLGLENTVWLNVVCLSVISTTLAAAGIPPCEGMLMYTIEAGYKDNVATYAVVSSLISTMYSAGAAIGAFAGGFLLDNFGYPTSAGICGGVSFFWGVLVLSYFLIFHNEAIPRKKNSNQVPLTGEEVTSGLMTQGSFTGSSLHLNKSLNSLHRRNSVHVKDANN